MSYILPANPPIHQNGMRLIKSPYKRARPQLPMPQILQQYVSQSYQSMLLQQAQLSLRQSNLLTLPIQQVEPVPVQEVPTTIEVIRPQVKRQSTGGQGGSLIVLFVRRGGVGFRGVLEGDDREGGYALLIEEGTHYPLEFLSTGNYLMFFMLMLLLLPFGEMQLQIPHLSPHPCEISTHGSQISLDLFPHLRSSHLVALDSFSHNILDNLRQVITKGFSWVRRLQLFDLAMQIQYIPPQIVNHPNRPLVIVPLLSLLDQAQDLTNFLHLRGREITSNPLLLLQLLQPAHSLLLMQQPLIQPSYLPTQSLQSSIHFSHRLLSSLRGALVSTPNGSGACLMLRFGQVEREGIFTIRFMQLRFVFYALAQFIRSDVIAASRWQLPLRGQLVLVKVALGLGRVILRLHVPLLVVLDCVDFQQVGGTRLADDLLLLHEWERGMNVVLVVLWAVGEGRTVEGVVWEGELGGLFEEGLGWCVIVGTHDSISNNYYIFHS